MKKMTLMLAVTLALSLVFLAACDSGSGIATDDDLCQAVFESFQNDDLVSFTSLYMNDETIAAIAAGLGEATNQEREIKAELLEFNQAAITMGLEATFQKVKADAQADGVDLKSGIYEGVVETDEEFEITNLAARTAKFLINFEAVKYLVDVDYLTSPEGFHIYESKVYKMTKVDVAFTSPEGDPVVVEAGADLDYEVTFDAETAGAQGAWIQYVFDGKNAGMVAGTTLESPVTSDIPGKILKSGTKHVLECRIHPVGQSTAYPLGVAKMNIEVK